MVEYTTDFYVLRPKDPAKGTGRILYEVNNRGRKMLFGNIADGPQGINDPGEARRPRQRLPDAPRLDRRLVRLGPRRAARQQGARPDRAGRDRQRQADHQDGARGMGLGNSRRRAGGVQALLRGDLDRAEQGDADGARARVGQADSRCRRPSGRSSMRKSIKLKDKAKPGFLYEFTYEAKNPKVQGLGFAATRDFVSWLKHDPKAAEVTGRHGQPCARPSASRQAGRYLRHHISAGFNRDEQGRTVFDGIHSHIAGVGRLFFDMPFSQPARTNTQHEDHGFPESLVPVLDRDARGSAHQGQGLGAARRRQRSQADRDQHLDRVLAEGRLAADHRSARHEGRGAARQLPRLHDRRHPAWRPRRRDHRCRPQRQSAQPAQSDGRGARAAGGARGLGRVRQGAAAEPRADARRRHAGRGRQDRLSGHPGRRRRAAHQRGGAQPATG